jgi:uncharacterized integral membrane protein (TIGR02327 family)
MPAAVQGVITIITLLLGTVIAWYALGVVRWEIFVKNVDSPTSRLLRMLLAIMIGTGISSFILQYIAGAAMIRG